MTNSRLITSQFCAREIWNVFNKFENAPRCLFDRCAAQNFRSKIIRVSRLRLKTRPKFRNSLQSLIFVHHRYPTVYRPNGNPPRLSYFLPFVAELELSLRLFDNALWRCPLWTKETYFYFAKISKLIFRFQFYLAKGELQSTKSKWESLL